jgi:hypothetical protein
VKYDLFAQACKATKGFKIATITSISIPRLLRYNYLFNSANNTKVFFILFIPFIPAFIIGTMAMFSDGELTGFFGVGNFTIRYYLGRNGENFVLKRQKFKAKQSES